MGDWVHLGCHVEPTSTLTTLSTAHDGGCSQELLTGVCTL